MVQSLPPFVTSISFWALSFSDKDREGQGKDGSQDYLCQERMETGCVNLEELKERLDHPDPHLDTTITFCSSKL